MPTLRKILAKDMEPLIRSCYAEDGPLLAQFHQGAGNGLDACVADTLQAIGPDTSFFRLENEVGAFVGFFGFLESGNVQVLQGFHLRNSFRTIEYKQAFWALMDETFNNEFYTSISANNIRARGFLLKNNFTIVNNLETHGRNFLILKKYKNFPFDLPIDYGYVNNQLPYFLPFNL